MPIIYAGVLEHLQCSHYENSIAQSWIVDFGRIGIKEGLRAEGMEGDAGEFADNPGSLTAGSYLVSAFF